MERWRKAASALVLLLITATGGFVAVLAVRNPGLPPPPSPPRIPTAAQLRSLQAQADAACLCDRRHEFPWRPQCWNAFNRNVARFDHWETASPCAEESTAVTCFGSQFSEDGPCVSRRRMYNACSDAEQRVRQAAARARRNSGCSD